MSKTITNLEATEKARVLLKTHTQNELSKKLGICRKTLHNKLRDNSWKEFEKGLLIKIK